MPSLASPAIPAGRLGRSAQPVLAAAGGLVLRPWSLADAGGVAAVYADPVIQRWHVFRADTEEEAAALIRRWQRAWAAETSAHWAVTDGPGGPLCGRMSLRTMDLTEGVAECAYWTAPGARGRGVAPRALSALSEWAFGSAGFHRLFLLHSTANPASCRVAAKAGFAAEGTERSSALHADGWHDMHVHARISGDPPAEEI